MIFILINFRCSLVCHKAHETANCCAELIDTQIANKSTEPQQRQERYLQSVPFKTEDTVEPEKLKELGTKEMFCKNNLVLPLTKENRF